MKRLILFLMLFSVIAINTGYGATADLNKNSDLIFTIDDDVGYDAVEITTVDFKLIINEKLFAMHSRTQHIDQMIFENFNYTFDEIPENYRQISFNRWQPPEKNNYNSLGVNFRNPRDSLDC